MSMSPFSALERTSGVPQGPARDVLTAAGVIPQRRNKSRMSELLDEKGLSLDAIADNLTYLANGAEKDETKIKVNELALKLHGELDGNNDAKGTINITFIGTDESTTQVLIPRS